MAAWKDGPCPGLPLVCFPWLLMLFFCDICLLGSQLLNQGVWILIKQQVWGSKDGRSPDIWSVIIGQKVIGLSFNSKHHTRLQRAYIVQPQLANIESANFYFFFTFAPVTVVSPPRLALKLRLTQTWIWINMWVAEMLNATTKPGGVIDCFHSLYGALRTFLTSSICRRKTGRSIEYFPISRKCNSTRKKRWRRVRCFAQWRHFINTRIPAHRLRHAANARTHAHDADE